MEPQNQSENNVVKNTTKSLKLFLYSDGGSRGNPGPSACGFVVEDANGELIEEGGEYLGVTTNNQAEYQGVRMVLERAIALGATDVVFRGDSLLVINQLNGIYKVKNHDLWPIYQRIIELAKQFQAIKFEHVYREYNQRADAMVNQILDERAHRGGAD